MKQNINNKAKTNQTKQRVVLNASDTVELPGEILISLDWGVAWASMFFRGILLDSKFNQVWE